MIFGAKKSAGSHRTGCKRDPVYLLTITSGLLTPDLNCSRTVFLFSTYRPCTNDLQLKINVSFMSFGKFTAILFVSPLMLKVCPFISCEESRIESHNLFPYTQSQNKCTSTIGLKVCLRVTLTCLSTFPLKMASMAIKDAPSTRKSDRTNGFWTHSVHQSHYQH